MVKIFSIETVTFEGLVNLMKRQFPLVSFSALKGTVILLFDTEIRDNYISPFINLCTLKVCNKTEHRSTCFKTSQRETLRLCE